MADSDSLPHVTAACTRAWFITKNTYLRLPSDTKLKQNIFYSFTEQPLCVRYDTLGNFVPQD